MSKRPVPAAVARVQGLRRSGAGGLHQASRDRRRVRSADKRRAVSEEW